MLTRLSNLHIRTKIILANGVAIILLALFAFVVYTNTNTLLETARWVDHTEKTIAMGHKLIEDLLNMETGQRGYLITGEPEFLEPYNKGKNNIFRELKEAIGLVRDNPGQVERLEKVEGLAKRWIKDAGEAEIVRRLETDRDEYLLKVEELIKKKTGKNLMDQLRRHLGEFISIEKGLLEERRKANDASASQTIFFIIAGTLASIVVIIASGRIIARSIVTPMMHLEEIVTKIGEGDLSVRPHIEGKDETSLLAKGVSLMAKKLEMSHKELMEAKEKAESAKAFTDKAINTQKDTFFLFRISNGKALLWNNAFRELSGYTDEEIADKKAPDDWYDPEELEKVAPQIMKAISDGQGTVEMSLVTKEGRHIPTEYKSSIIYDENGQPDQMIAIGRDITERRVAEVALKEAKEKAEMASRTKSEFLANMSHEIRTPMTSILGMAELLLEADLGDEQAEYVERLTSSGYALIRIINDILDLSKVESGVLELEEINFSLGEEIEKIMSIFGIKSAKKGLKLKKYIVSDVDDYYLGDPIRLRQVLINLVGNALKFTEHGEVKISVERGENGACREECKLLFSVSDTGIGIPEDKLATVFNPFSQGDSSTTRIHGGTGLGLAISKKLVHLMGGALEVESKKGEGTRFFFTLKMKKGYLEEAPHEEETEALVEGKEKALKILLAEDAEDNRLIVKHFLKNSPHTLHMVENGEEVIELLNAEAYDLVLMDMQMPVMDGYTATRIIRGWEARNKKEPVPIIAFTAHAMKEEISKCLDAGCSDHLSKPIRKKDLLRTIGKYALKG